MASQQSRTAEQRARARTTDVNTVFARLHEQYPELDEEHEKQAPRFAAIQALIEARRRRKLSQADLARAMGVRPSVVSRLESAGHSPRLDTLAAAAQAMGYDLEVKFKRRSRPRVAEPIADYDAKPK